MTAIRNWFQSTAHEVWDHAYHESQKVVGETNILINKSDSSFLQIGRKYYPVFKKFLGKVSEVVEKVIKILITVGLFFANTTFFMIGAAAAIVFPEQMRSAVDRISQVWDSLPKSLRFCVFAPLPFAWPSYFIIAAPFVGAYVSLYLQDKAGVVRPSSPRLQQAASVEPPFQSQRPPARRIHREGHRHIKRLRSQKENLKKLQKIRSSHVKTVESPLSSP